jgi:penicillin-binding protein 1A
VGTGAAWVAIRALSRDLPSPARLQTIRPPSKTLIFSADGDTLHEYYTQNRVILPLEEIPQGLVDAVISTEDHRFYQHYGVDLGGIARAVLVNIRNRSKTQGASTLSQQLARSLFLTPDKRWERKVRELLLALQIERSYTKDEILEMYLNTVYFGHGGAYGVESGARTFFGRGVAELEPHEYTMLAGVLANPGYYSPVHHLDRAYQRRAIVLRSMVREGYLTPGEAEEIGQTEVAIAPARERERLAPYFVETVRQYLEQNYGTERLYEEGLRVYTTLDSRMQRLAEAALEEHLLLRESEANYEMTRALYDSLYVDTEDKPLTTYLQGALFAMDPHTGEVRAMIGGRDFSTSRWNRALQGKRQPGSIFKPFLYTAALERGWTPADILLDAPVEVDTGSDELWRPVNFDETFRGPVSVRYALANSINSPAVRLILQIGTQPVLEVARRMGVTSNIPDVYSIALGSGEADLQELVTAYSTFANSGLRTRPLMIWRITDSRGEILEENRSYQEEVLDERINYVMVDMMRTAIREGTGRGAAAYGWKRDSAGKTGTTDRNTDAWFIGYTPDLVCGVWVGFDDKISMGRRKTGAVMAMPIWAKMMTAYFDGMPEPTFPRPEGIVPRLICVQTGQLATAACPEVGEEIFVEGMVPTRSCELHQPGSTEVPEQTGDFESLDRRSQRGDEFGGGGGY